MSHLIRFIVILVSLLSFSRPLQAQPCPIPATCTPGAASSASAPFFLAGIYQVTLGSINHNTGGFSDGYKDYSCTIRTSLTLSAPQAITITTGNLSPENVRVWIDYDNNGIFDPTAELFFSSNNATTHTGANLSLPATAVTGTPLRLRISSDINVAPFPTPCSTPLYGQVEDYAVTLVTANGAPTAALQAAAVGTGCSGTFQFSDYSLGSPTSWRWDFGDGQTSNQANPTHTYNQPGQYVVRLRVCNAFGCDSATLPDPLAWYAPLPGTPCTFPFQSPCCGYGMTRVSLAGQTQTVDTSGYQDFTCRRRFSLIQGQPYLLQVFTTNTPHAIVAWIDYNNDDNFSISETVLWQPSGIGALDSIVVPPTAVVDVPLRMRIVSAYGNYSPAPCSSSSNSQTLDFSVVIRNTGQCSNLPPLSPLQVQYDPCLGAQARLVLPNPVTGALLQWQSSPDSLVWTAVAGATHFIFRTPAVTSKIYYRVQVTCGNQVRYSPGWPFDTVPCYCRNLHTASNGISCLPFFYFFRHVSITNTSLSNTVPRPCVHAPDSTQQSFPLYPRHLTTTLRRGSTYELKFLVGDNNQPAANLWIDYNRNGTFDPAEYRLIGQGLYPHDTTSFVFTVPDSAALGVTGMRIRLNVSPLRANAACYSLNYGSAQDYTLTILPDVCSTTTLRAGTVQGSPVVCPGRIPDLQVTGYTPGAFVQWQASPDGLTWLDLPHAHHNRLQRAVGAPAWNPANRYVRAKVSCDSLTVTFTPAVQLQDDFQRCYCTQVATACGEPALRAVRLGNTSLLDQSTLCPAGSYRLADPTQPHLTATLLRGVSYPLTISPALRPAGGQRQAFDAVLWVDYDHNGAFQPREQTTIRVHPLAADTTVTLTIPPSALLGATRLRLVVRDADTTFFDPAELCAYPGPQEIRDYIITIAAPPATTQPLTAGTLYGQTNVCAGTGFRLWADQPSFDATLQWQEQTPTGWLDLTGQTRPSLIHQITTNTTFRLAATRGGTTVYSQPLAVFTAGPCHCTAGLNNSGPSSLFKPTALAGPGTHFYLNATWTNTSYRNFTAGADTLPATLYRGRQYSFGAQASALWIDFNKNGVFDPLEYFALPTNLALRPITFTVPVTTALGSVRARIRYSTRPFTDVQACTIPSTAQLTTDFLFTIADAPAFLAPTLVAPDSVCVGDNVQLGLSTPLPPGTTYQWEGPQGSLGNAPQVTSFPVTTADAGYYYLTATAPNGYQLTVAHHLKVCNVTGLTRPSAGLAVELYPNPAARQTTLRIQGPSQPLTVRVISSTGQLVATHQLDTAATHQLNLDVSRYPKGLYLVQVQGAKNGTCKQLMVE